MYIEYTICQTVLTVDISSNDASSIIVCIKENCDIHQADQVSVLLLISLINECIQTISNISICGMVPVNCGQRSAIHFLRYISSTCIHTLRLDYNRDILALAAS